MGEVRNILDGDEPTIITEKESEVAPFDINAVPKGQTCGKCPELMAQVASIQAQLTSDVKTRDRQHVEYREDIGKVFGEIKALNISVAAVGSQAATAATAAAETAKAVSGTAHKDSLINTGTLKVVAAVILGAVITGFTLFKLLPGAHP